MTNQDLRAKYKKDTGIYAGIKTEWETQLDGDLTIEELDSPIEVEIDIDLSDIPYLIWLEEQLINLKQ